MFTWQGNCGCGCIDTDFVLVLFVCFSLVVFVLTYNLYLFTDGINPTGQMILTR